MSTADPDKLCAAIARALEALSEVQGAFLFGSHATGRARPDSDVDVAVLLDASAAPHAGRARLSRIIEALGREIAADVLDVVILNDAPPALAFQVLKHGRVAYQRDAVALHRFRVRTYGMHADYAPVERFFREVTRRRALGETRRG